MTESEAIGYLNMVKLIGDAAEASRQWILGVQDGRFPWDILLEPLPDGLLMSTFHQLAMSKLLEGYRSKQDADDLSVLGYALQNSITIIESGERKARDFWVVSQCCIALQIQIEAAIRNRWPAGVGRHNLTKDDLSILESMLELDCTPETPTRKETVGESALGVSDIRDNLKRLKNAEYVGTRRGRGGGIYLTEAGHERARLLQKK